MQRVHVYSFPPPVPPVPDPNAPPPDLRPIDFLYFTVMPFTGPQTLVDGYERYPGGATLFTWHQRATEDEPAQVCRVLYPINFTEIPVFETTARFPTFLFYYNVDPWNTHKLHYDFSTWTSPFQASYLDYREENLTPNAAAVFGRLKPHLNAIVEQATAQLENQATAQVPEPIPYVPGQRKFYRVIETRLDTDGDGLFDDEEMGEFNSDPYSYDTDGDGYSDGHEIDAGSDPGDASQNPVNGGSGPSLPEGEDEDGDGLSNEEEQRLGTNPRSKDTDKDGAWDGAEMHPTEKLLTFGPGMSGRYIDLEVGEGELVSVNNSGKVIYRTETESTSSNTTGAGQKVYDYYLWDVAESGLTNLKATVGEDQKERLTYGGISDAGTIFGSGKRKSAHSDKYYEQAFTMDEGFAITWLKGSEEPDQAPLELPPITSMGSGSNPFSYGAYFGYALGMDRYESVYATEGRDGLSGNVPSNKSPAAVLVSRSLTIWGSGAGNYGAVGAYFFAPNGDAQLTPPGKEITAGTLLALSPEGRSVSMQERVTWVTTKGPSLVNEPAYEGGSYFSVYPNVGTKLGLYYRKNTASSVDDGSIPNNSVMIKFPATGDPNFIDVRTISDMAKEESTPEGIGFMNGPVAGGSYQGKASFWVNQNGKWERSELKTASADGPPMEPVMGKVSFIEDDGDMWVDDGDGGYWLWNGRQLMLFSDILEYNAFEAPEEYLLKQITTKGIIGCEKNGVVRLLLPAEFATRGKNDSVTKTAATILAHGEQPIVSIDPVTTADVTVSGSVATIQLSGSITDSIMGTVPPGQGADILKVNGLVNDSLTEAEAPLTRETGHTSLFAPYGKKATFTGLSIEFPAEGVQRIRVETAPNAAGLTGYKEIEVVFSKTWPAPVTVGSATSVYDLIFPSSITPGNAETIQVALEAGEPFADLLETEPDSQVFRHEESGVTLWLNAPFAPTSEADALRCTLYVPGGSPTRGSSVGEVTVTCLETGGQTLRFRHTTVLAPMAVGGVPVDALQSVTVLNHGPDSTAFPITFRSAGVGEEPTLNLFGADFQLEAVPGQNQFFATTGGGKPLLGFLVRKEDTTAETESLEFIYYDHTASSLKRVARSNSTTEEEWDLVLGPAGLPEKPKIPLKRISMLNADGSAGEGFVPVEIDALISILEGDTYVEILEDSQYLYEFSGVKQGEVMRVASQDFPEDRFDLIVPGEEPKLIPHSRNAELTAVSPGVYRTAQKVVVYSSGPEGPQTLTDAQWDTLKTMGFLAVHNGSPVVRCAADIDQLLLDEGITDIHPPSDLVFGDGAIAPTKSSAYRHKGYTDHHVMNVYHKNPAKQKKWFGMLKTMFGENFHPDEFTIPVHDRLHKKAQHLATQVWDDFFDGIDAFFDGDGKPLPGVTSDQIADMRYRTWTAVDDSINAMSGTKLKVDRGRMRIWPAVLDKANHPLRNQFLDGGWRMGSSAGRYLEVDTIVTKGVKDASKLGRLKSMRKTLTKSVFKGGAKAVVMAIACSVLKGYAIAEMAYGTLNNGWVETLAQKLNADLDLEDIDLARQIVSEAFTTDIIPGGTRVVQHKLPNGNIVAHGDLTFRVYGSATGSITAVDDFIVTEMKIFPEGTFKVAIVSLTPPFNSIVIDDPPWFIRGWYPHVGGKSADYFEAVSKAERNTQ